MRICSPNISSMDILYSRYKNLPGKSNSTREDFFQFMNTASVERSVFLDSECNMYYEEANEVAVPIMKPK